jgi:hypothetical protein
MKIHEGAKVYDREHNEIGHVDDVFLGYVQTDTVDSAETTAAGSFPAGTNTQSITPNFAMGGTANASDSEPVKSVKNRLLREGFVHIETGILSRDRVVLPDQIAKVEDRALVLNVTKDQLLKDDILNNMS